MQKSSLKNRIVIFSSLFVFVLLLVIIVFLYVTGNDYIREASKNKTIHTSNFISHKLEQNLSDVNFELAGLRARMGTPNIELLDGQTPPEEIKSILNQFLLSNPFRYHDLLLCNNELETAFHIMPQKVFSGEFIIEEELLSKNEYNNLLSKSKANGGSHKKEYFFNEITKVFYFSIELTKGDDNNKLILGIRMTEVINNLISELIDSEDIEISLSGNDDVILFSNNMSNLTKLNNQVYPKQIIASKNQGTITDSFENNSSIASSYLDIIGCSLIVKHDFEKMVDELNSLSLRAFGFALLLFLIILTLVKYFSDRIFLNVSKVTDQLIKISGGDFSHKIPIFRNDELGIMIDSFNNMVDRLSESYNELKKVNENLRINNEELTRTKTELTESQRLAVIGETISKISHDIQNKVGGINIWVQNLEMQIGSDEVSKVYLAEIKKSVSSFLNMLNEFKKYYRKPALNKSKGNINHLLTETLTNLKDEFLNKTVAQNISFHSSIPDTEFDHEMLNRVFTNIILNGLYYTPINSSITIKTELKDNKILLRFIDEGIGFKSGNIQNIFSPFFTTKTEGSGLGLAISKNIVAAHQGIISASNSEKCGAIITIELPID